MSKNTKITVYDMVIVGVMAAVIFTLTYFVRIPIPTPAGETNLKVANIFCLLAGILFGGLRGGLAAGLGSMMFDLLNPLYITSAPSTLINFFLMAFICGIIANSGKKNSTLKTVIATTAGAFSYVILYITKSVLSATIQNVGLTSDLFSSLGFEAFKVAVAQSSFKMVTSSTNAIIAIVFASLLAPVLKVALTKVGIYQKIKI